MRLAPVALTFLALTLSACEGGGDPVEQALRDASAERQAALVKDGEVSGAAPVDPASSATADEAYVARMIEHHRGAVAMAEAALRESRDPEVRRMAQEVIDTRTREIAAMQAWRASSSTGE